MTDGQATTTRAALGLAAVLDGLLAPARIAQDAESMLAAMRVALPGVDLAPARQAAVAAVEADRRALLAELAAGLQAEAGTDETTGSDGGINYDTGSFADARDWILRALDLSGEQR